MSWIFNYGIAHWQDANGNIAQSFLVTQDQAPGRETELLPLISALAAASDAGIVAVQMVTTTILTPTYGTGPYKTVFDRGVLLGNIPATTRAQRQSIIGPKQAIFLPGNQQINLSNTLVLNVQSEVMALLGDSTGNPCGPFVRGNRQTAAGS